MKIAKRIQLGLVVLAVFGIAIPATMHSFPPAPHHTIFGIVRDELGTPLSGSNIQVFLETTNGTRINGNLLLSEPGENYRLTIPMDAGITADAYKPTALQPNVSFRMKVQIGNTVFLPIEMSGSLANLGQPAQSTRIDLTIGEDTDGDGLPDAWERWLIEMLCQQDPTKCGLTLADINPGGDADGDGMSNYDEYIAGTYPFDAGDGLALSLVGFSEADPVLEFLVIRNRSYVLYGSEDLQTWVTVPFKITSEGPAAAVRQHYLAPDVRNLQVKAVFSEPSGLKFFKVKVQ